MVTVTDNKKIISLQDFPKKGLADDHGMITVELASTLFSLGIHVNQDAIKTESSTASLEPLLGSELGSKPSEEMRESASQQAGSVNQRVLFRFPTNFILGKYGDETQGYSLVSTLIRLNFDVPTESRLGVVRVIVRVDG